MYCGTTHTSALPLNLYLKKLSTLQYLLKYGEIVILVSRTSDFKPRGRAEFFFILSPKLPKKPQKAVEISIYLF
jgi:hypothetical protein